MSFCRCGSHRHCKCGVSLKLPINSFKDVQDNQASLENVVDRLNDVQVVSNEAIDRVVEQEEFLQGDGLKAVINGEVVNVVNDSFVQGVVEDRLVALESSYAPRLDNLKEELRNTSVSLSDFPRLEGETDDSARLQRAIDFCHTNRYNKLMFNVDLTLASTVYLKNFVVIEGDSVSKIIHTGSGNAFEVVGISGLYEYGGLKNLTLQRGIVREGVGTGVYIEMSNAGTVKDVENITMDKVVIKGFEYGIRFNYLDNQIGITGLKFNDMICKENHYGFALTGNVNGYTTTWFNVNVFTNCQFDYNKFVGFYINYIGSVFHLNFINCIFAVNGENGYIDRNSQVGGFLSTSARVDASFNDCFFEFNYLFRKATPAEVTNFTTNGTLTEKGTYIIDNEEYVGGAWNGIFAINLPASNRSASLSMSYGSKITLNNTSIQNSTRYCYGLNSGEWFINTVKFSTFGNVIRTVPNAWVILNSKVANEKLNCTINSIQPSLQYGSIQNISGDSSQSIFIDHSKDLRNGDTIYVDGINGLDTNMGVYNSPYKTFDAVVRRLRVSNVNFINVVVKSSSFVEMNTTYSGVLNNMSVVIKSEDSGNKSTVLFKKHDTLNELYNLNVNNSLVSFEDVDIILDYEAATSGLNHTYAVITTSSTLKFKNCNIDSNNQYLALQSIPQSTGVLILDNVTTSGVPSKATKLFNGSGTTILNNTPLTGWTEIKGLVQ